MQYALRRRGIFFLLLMEERCLHLQNFSVIFNVKNRFQIALKSIFIFFSLNNIKEKGFLSHLEDFLFIFVYSICRAISLIR